ncbi:MAG: carbon-nitrogen hydrolase family protein [Clostridia bacterium]|nr:carbon-nitrogen hydrolase family protein [Clostridia bacterium]
MKIALIQMAVGRSKSKNIAAAVDLIGQAKTAGAEVAVLPEMFCCPYANAEFIANAEERDGEAQTALKEAAAAQKIYVIGGSIPEKEDGKLFNSCFIFNDSGETIARHRKIHLFDINAEGQFFRESDTFSAGSQATVFDTPYGKIGVCICFDMRFEELCHEMMLSGAEVIVAPAAFNMTTGPAHWELLFRQRAVDNQLFTIGVSPSRNRRASYVAYGNSIAVDPWGRVIVRAGSRPQLLIAELELPQIAKVRAALPIVNLT